MSSISASEISKLDDKSKKDMLDFIEGENSKQKIQMAVHKFTKTCFQKCVNNVEANDLTSNEEQCLANCVNRFLDVNIRVINGLQNSASQ
ncbi:mitochondrial import inner membrane translocase subunit Tim8p [Monosporozyma unispora]